MIQVKAPDGSIVQFPDGTPDTTIEGVMKQNFGGPQQQPAAPAQSGFDQFKSMVANGQVGMPQAPYPDQFASGIAKGIIGLAETPGAIRDLTQRGIVWGAGKLGATPEQQQAMTAANKAQQSLPYGFGGMMAGAPGPGTLQPEVEKITGPFRKPQTGMESLVDRAGTLAPGLLMGPGAIEPKLGGLLGSTLGGAGGRKLAEATGHEKIAPYADFGGTLLGGAAGLTAVEALNAGAATKAAVEAAPKTAQLEATAKQLYKQADEIGLAVKPQGYSNMVDEVYKAARNDGFFAANHPKLANAFNELEKWRGSPVTLDELQQLRRNIKSAYSATEPDQNRVMQTALNKFDDFMENLKPDQAVSGDTRAATILLKEANPTWAKFRKAELFDNITENAKNTVGANYTEAGFQTAVRQQLRGIAKDNFKRFKYMTPEERDMINGVIRGGSVENLLRRWGGYSLLSSTGGIKSGGAAYLANLLFGPAGGAVVGGVLGGGGTVARPISTAMSKNAFDMLKATVRNGGALTQNAAPSLLSSQVPIQGLLRLNTLPQVRGANH